MQLHFGVAVTEAVVRQFASKNKPYLEASRSPNVTKWNASRSWLSQGCIHCVFVVEHEGVNSVWSFRRFIADEDPLFHKSFLERIFDPDPERYSIGLSST